MWREPGLMSHSSNGLQGKYSDCHQIKYKNGLIVRSLGIGIKKEEAKESGNGVDIFLYSCAALMVAAWNRKKIV